MKNLKNFDWESLAEEGSTFFPKEQKKQKRQREKRKEENSKKQAESDDKFISMDRD